MPHLTIKLPSTLGVLASFALIDGVTGADRRSEFTLSLWASNKSELQIKAAPSRKVQ